MLEPPNPFSTCFVRPGALGYRRHDAGCLEKLVDDFFERYRGWAAVVGPHGSGKSTLLADCQPYLNRRTRLLTFRLSTAARNARAIWQSRPQWSPSTTLIIDGYEQLQPWSALRLLTAVRRHGAKLLVTAHRKRWAFPTLWKTDVDERLAEELLHHLLRDRPDLSRQPDLEQAWATARQRHPSDLRETFMSMYDWVEDKKQKRPASR
jgi:hypothetical protein